MLHELKEDQLDQIIGEFAYLKDKVGEVIALCVEVPKTRELEVHSFFAKLTPTFTDYRSLSDNGNEIGWIYKTDSVLFVTKIVEATISSCLMITEYK